MEHDAKIRIFFGVLDFGVTDGKDFVEGLFVCRTKSDNFCLLNVYLKPHFSTKV